MKYTQPASPRPPAANPQSAAAWCLLLQRAGRARTETVDIPEGADDAAVLRAWRSAAVRAADLYREPQAGRHSAAR